MQGKCAQERQNILVEQALFRPLRMPKAAELVTSAYRALIMAHGQYGSNVFINCPYHESYTPIFLLRDRLIRLAIVSNLHNTGRSVSPVPPAAMAEQRPDA